MKRQNLSRQRAFCVLDQISGRTNRGEITDLLIGAGCIPDSAENYREYQEHQAAEYLRAHRSQKMRTNEIQKELVHLFELKEDGSKEHYFKPCGELNAQEAAQHLEYWAEKIREDQSKFSRYYRFHVSQHGKKLQRLLDFEMTVA